MNQNPEQKIIAEQQQRHETIKLLKSTEGWEKLTEKQQSIIKQSLLINDLTERSKDEATRLKGSETNQLLFYHMPAWFCHIAVDALEQEKTLGPTPIPAKPRDGFFTAEYEPYSSLNALNGAIVQFGFPCVVHVLEEDPKGDDPYMRHTFVALGVDDEGGVLTWEKIYPDKPYRFGKLKDITDYYGIQEYKESGGKLTWGIRKLHTKTDNDNE